MGLRGRRILPIFIFSFLIHSSVLLQPSSALLLFQYFFDTPAGSASPTSAGSATLYDTQFYKLKNGMLVFLYSSTPSLPPTGIEYTLPESAEPAGVRDSGTWGRGAAEPAERIIEMSFGGGGTEMSNSLFICYAIGPGKGLSLPPFPYGLSSNRLSGDRTGYILRFLRHGDGVDEVIVYRNDNGWVKKLKNVSMPSNPVTTLRRVEIRHRKTGEHIVRAAFDTGTLFEKRFEFSDPTYPPGDEHRRFQVIVKAHSSSSSMPLYLSTDSWIIRDVLPEYIRPGTAGPTNPLRTPRAPAAGDDAEMLLALADTALANVDYSEAYNDVTRALAIRQKKLGPAHPKTAEAMYRLAMLHAHKNSVEAERLYKRALMTQTNAVGPDHLDLVPTLTGLANLYQNMGGYSDAETIYARALAIQQKKLGPDHRDILPTLSGLATVRLNQHRLDDAMAVYRRALAIKEKIFSLSDPELLSTLKGMAAISMANGDAIHSQLLYNRILQILEKTNGPDHPDVAAILEAMAEQMPTDRWNEAETLYKRGLAIREKAQGVNHTSTENCLLRLAAIYFEHGQKDDAQRLYERAVDIRKKALGPGHPDVAVAMRNLASIYAAKKKYPEAAETFEMALAVQQNILEPDNPEMAVTCNNLGVAYKMLGRPREAETMYKRALAVREKVLGANHPSTRTTLRNLADLYKYMNRPLEAEYYAARAGSAPPAPQVPASPTPAGKEK